MSNVDTLLYNSFLRRGGPPDEALPPDVVARFLVTKTSWRGRYRRVLAVTPSAIVTQHPDDLAITNTWSFVGDSDVDDVAPGGGAGEEQELVLSVRKDARSKHKPTKFMCKQRGALLTVLYQCIAAAGGACPISRKLLGAPTSFQVHKLRRGAWQPVQLRITPVAVERLDIASGAVKWRLEFQHMGSPAVRLLKADAAGGGEPGRAFALCGRPGWRTRIYASPEREAIVRALQGVASKKLAIHLAVDTRGEMTAGELVDTAAGIERERAAEPGETPLGEWEAWRVRPSFVGPLTAWEGAQAGAEDATMDAGSGAGGAGVLRSPRRLVLTARALLERRTDSYEVALRHPLGDIVALVRHARRPQWLGVEWAGGAPPALFVTPARDALAAALLDAAQIAAGRPIPVLPHPSSPGSVIRSGDPGGGPAPVTSQDPELERIALAALCAAARDALPALRGGMSDGVDASHGGVNGSAGGGRSGFPMPAPKAGAAASAASTPSSSPPTGGQGQNLGFRAQPAQQQQPPAPTQPPQQQQIQQQQQQAAAAAGSNLSAFAKTAFQRDARPGQQRPGGPGAPPSGISSEEAIALLGRRVHEFNACVPYGGVAAGARPDEALLPALFALLPTPLAVGISVAPPETQAAVELVAVLQALQRLSASRFASAEALVSPPAAGRVFAALSCGDDAVAAEAARLLTRLWAPAAARTGVPPWRLTRSFSAAEDDASSANSGDDNLTARAAKAVCLGPPGRTAQLLALLGGHRRAPPPLAVMAAVEALAAVACDPGARTTEGLMLRALLTEAAAVGRPLFALFSHPAARVLDGAALIMRAIAEGGAAAAGPLREAALAEGAMLHHLHLAVTAQGARARLSQDLVALWGDGCAPAAALLRRVFPPGLLRFLSLGKGTASSAAASKQRQHQQRQEHSQQHSQQQQQQPAGSGAATAGAAGGSGSQQRSSTAERPAAASGIASSQDPLRGGGATANGSVGSSPRSSINSPRGAGQAAGSGGGGGRQIGSAPRRTTGSLDGVTRPQQQQQQQQRPHSAGRERGNWEAMWAAVARDHHHAGLIWNETTRAELRLALQNEEAALRAARTRAGDGATGGGAPAWNHAEFVVRYPSLDKHLAVGGVYLNLLLDGADQGAVDKLPAPAEVFTALQRAFLCLADPAVAGSGGSGSGTVATAAALGRSAEADRLTIALAMAAVYSAHAGAIGPFTGLDHIIQLADRTPSRSLRHTLLRVLQAALLPAGPAPSDVSTGAPAGNAASGAGADAARGMAAVANCDAFLAAGGVQLAVDLLACAHESKERTRAPLATNLISHAHAAEDSREWRYFLPPGAAAPPGAASEETQWGMQVGPVTKDEIRSLYGKGRVGDGTLFRTADMAEPAPLAAIRELRWWVATGAAKLEPFEQAGVALSLLRAAADAHPAVDASGAVLAPLPGAHRALTSPGCLPHVVQLMATGEPALVAGSAAMLETILRHDGDALPRLYATGAFFFALAYCGSNLLEIARLLRVAHLEQAELRPASASGGLASRSFLGGLLPESLLYVLQAGGPAAFAAALAGDSDTPELIWTHRMRGQRLVPQMLQHLGDFPSRLAEHGHAVYEYTPCPPIGYPELEAELWCHRYYLRNLCDTERFPDWPLVDHVPFLQALLDTWRAELSRRPLDMSEADAAAVLGLPPPDADGSAAFSEDDLKAAYRAAARKYHPDKNPAGRDKFVAVGAAYERLRAGAAGRVGTRPSVVLLLLKAQCILFARCPEVLAPFKYAGYPMLLDAVALPADEDSGDTAHFLGPERAPQLQAAVELCWLTCVSSALNGEELTRCGGVATLGQLLTRTASVLPADVLPTQPGAVIATHCLRTFAGMAAFASARADLAEREVLVGDIVRTCRLERAAAAVDAALQCIFQMAVDPVLQDLLMRVGVIPHVLALLFSYDATAEAEDEEGDDTPAAGAGGGAAAAAAAAEERGPKFLGLGIVRSNMQAAKNHHAVLAARALGRLAGCHGAPRHAAAAAALGALLTGQLAGRLGGPDPRPLLRDLNRSVATPTVIWSSQMRGEVLEALAAQRAGTAADASPSPDSGFRFASLEGELAVAGVYVRVFNQQPNFPLADPATFCKGLVMYINGSMKEEARAAAAALSESPTAEDTPEQARRREHLAAALQALQHAVEGHPRLAMLMASRPALAPLLDVLERSCRRLHEVAMPTGALEPPQEALAGPQAAHIADTASLALAVLVRLTAHAGCVEALAEPRALRDAFWTLHRPPGEAAAGLALRLLHGLAATPAAAWAAAGQGGAVYALSVLLPTAPPDEARRETRETLQAATASLLGRFAAQPLHGPRVMLLLSKLLPPGLAAAVRDGPGEAAVAALRTASETPERLWSAGMAAALGEELAHLAGQARAAQAAGQVDWGLPEGWRLEHPALAGEELLGGVYVRLFLKNPAFPLRNPRAFLQGLLEAYTSEVGRGGGADARRAATLAAASCELLRGHAALGDHAVGLGYADRLLALLSARLKAMTTGSAGGAPDEVAGSALRLLHQLAAADAGGEALARATPPLVAALRPALAPTAPPAVAALAMETLQRALSPANRFRDLLVEAALAHGVVPLLLARLDWRASAPAAGSSPAKSSPVSSGGAVAEDRSGGGGGGGSGASAAGSGGDRDEAVARVLAVDVLHLLAAEGAHAAQVNRLLSESKVWAAFRGQKHDLFLPAGGPPNAGVAGLLQGGPSARFALPAAPSAASQLSPTPSAEPPLPPQPAASGMPPAATASQTPAQTAAQSAGDSPAAPASPPLRTRVNEPDAAANAAAQHDSMPQPIDSVQSEAQTPSASQSLPLEPDRSAIGDASDAASADAGTAQSDSAAAAAAAPVVAQSAAEVPPPSAQPTGSQEEVHADRVRQHVSSPPRQPDTASAAGPGYPSTEQDTASTGDRWAGLQDSAAAQAAAAPQVAQPRPQQRQPPQQPRPLQDPRPLQPAPAVPPPTQRPAATARPAAASPPTSEPSPAAPLPQRSAPAATPPPSSRPSVPAAASPLAPRARPAAPVSPLQMPAATDSDDSDGADGGSPTDSKDYGPLGPLG